MNVKDFYEKLIACHDELDVAKSLKHFLDMNPGAGFVALGTKEEGAELTGLSSVAGNQASNPLVAFKELATNAFDAELDFFAPSLGLDLRRHKSPSSAWAEVMEALESSGKKLPLDQIVVSRARDKASKANSLTLMDRGSGQANSAMIRTMLSLSAGEQNKADLDHSFGSFGQGGSAVHRHSGMMGFKLIATGVGDGEWSVGFIRRRPGPRFILEWLSLDPKARSVPSFKAGSIRPLRKSDGSGWEGKFGGDDGKIVQVSPDLARGTAVKVYSYEGASRSKAEFTSDLIDPFLDTLPHPIFCVDFYASSKPPSQEDGNGSPEERGRRHLTGGADVRWAKGARSRLGVDKPLARSSEEVGIPPRAELPRVGSFSFNVDNPAHELWAASGGAMGEEEPERALGVKVDAVFIPAVKKVSATGAVSWERRIQDFSSTRVFVSYFGQLHAVGVEGLDGNRFLRDIAEMPHSKDEVALFVDISGLGKEYFNGLFMSSRDRVAQTVWYANFAQALRGAVRKQSEEGLLGEWERVCKSRERASDNLGLLEEDGEGGFKAGRSFAQMSGLTQAVARQLRRSLPKAMAMAPLAGKALEAGGEGVLARVGGERSAAQAASVEATGQEAAGAAAGGGRKGEQAGACKPRAAVAGRGRKVAQASARKPKAGEPSVASRACGKSHTVAMEVEAGGAEWEEDKPVPPVSVVGAELEVVAKGKKRLARADVEDFVVEGTFRDARGNSCYSVGVRKGSAVAARMARDGACVVLTLRQDGREELVHAKVLWEAKGEAKGAAKRGAKEPAGDDPSQSVVVRPRLASRDGRKVGNMQTCDFGTLGFDPLSACEVSYGGRDGSGAHLLTATFNVDHKSIEAVFDAGCASGYLRSMRDAIGEKSFLAMLLMDQRAAAKRAGWRGDGEAEGEAPPSAERPTGVDEKKLMDWLDWGRQLALDGHGFWDLDAISGARAAIELSARGDARKAPKRKRA